MKTLLIVGCIFLLAGVGAMLPISPVETMDCGCGGAAACQTKQLSVLLGAGLFALGVVCSAVAALMKLQSIRAMSAAC